MENINSCLMLACALYTPVDLFSIFNSSDLEDIGIERESHITLLYAKGVVLPKNEILENIKDILGEEDFSNLLNMFKNAKDEVYSVIDLFDLDKFENDSDYIVLKLKKDCEYYKYLYLINKVLSKKYKVTSDFSSYTPHLTLVKLKKGKSRKYLDNDILYNVVKDSRISLEDFIISYGTSDSSFDRDKFNLTTFNAVSRFFRLQGYENSKNELIEE